MGVAIKLADKLNIAAGRFDSLILKTRKTTICFYLPAMPVVRSTLLCPPFYSAIFSSPLLPSQSICLDPFVFTTPFSHSIDVLFCLTSFPSFRESFFLTLSNSLVLVRWEIKELE